MDFSLERLRRIQALPDSDRLGVLDAMVNSAAAAEQQNSFDLDDIRIGMSNEDRARASAAIVRALRESWEE